MVWSHRLFLPQLKKRPQSILPLISRVSVPVTSQPVSQSQSILSFRGQFLQGINAQCPFVQAIICITITDILRHCQFGQSAVSQSPCMWELVDSTAGSHCTVSQSALLSESNMSLLCSWHHCATQYCFTYLPLCSEFSKTLWHIS